VKQLKNKDQLLKVANLAKNDFDLDLNSLAVANYSEFLTWLTAAVQHLIDTDFERFLNTLYRIDVDEIKVKLAFTSKTNVAEAIATLIIERELQKVETREKYRSK
jgi:hypothetical protein